MAKAKQQPKKEQAPKAPGTRSEAPPRLLTTYRDTISPQLVKAKKSVAAFKLRAGQTVGIKTTLRGRRMWYFLDKLLNVALPRIRDFRGVNPDGFDGRGNYSLGLREQVVFPEIDYDKIDKLRGLEVSIVTTARSDDEARSLLTRLGMPFRKR